MEIKQTYTDIIFDQVNTVYLDIETTGFSPKSSVCYIVGTGVSDNGRLCIRQYFLKDIERECELMKHVSHVLEKFRYVVTFNGETFDLNYLNNKFKIYNIKCCFPESKDVYKFFKSGNKVLNFEKLGLKNLEISHGIERDFKINGLDSIKMFNKFLFSNDICILDEILLYNFEDVLNLYRLDFKKYDHFKKYGQISNAGFIFPTYVNLTKKNATLIGIAETISGQHLYNFDFFNLKIENKVFQLRFPLKYEEGYGGKNIKYIQLRKFSKNATNSAENVVVFEYDKKIFIENLVKIAVSIINKFFF